MKTHWDSFLKEKSFPRMAAVLAVSPLCVDAVGGTGCECM